MASVNVEGPVVKSVQELSINGVEPPHYYIRREDDRPVKASAPTSPIPVIDLVLLFSDSKEKEMEKLRHGFWYLQTVGHGIPSSLLDEVGKIAKEFYNLPPEEKRRYSTAVANEDGEEGYGNDDQIPAENQIIDWSDRLYLLVLPEDQRNTTHWPDNPTTFRTIND
ncbi:flavonol synthase/flavanone 3-hydroxylase-like [Magnolia sinica]|uniref:flavonol synthase/flavanone 3-hydroxylase-like n=1 Tax=Magnolia sinica TaxID=86752 RepID=UPI002657E023|nr:flavonol synthase/flavanone 3-hydroxylase-like [Magnolia sinica]